MLTNKYIRLTIYARRFTIRLSIFYVFIKLTILGGYYALPTDQQPSKWVHTKKSLLLQTAL